PARGPASLPGFTSRNSRAGRARTYALASRSRLPAGTAARLRPIETKASARTRPSLESVCARAVGNSKDICAARSIPAHSCRNSASRGVRRMSANPESSSGGPREDGGSCERAPRSDTVTGTWAAKETWPPSNGVPLSWPPSNGVPLSWPPSNGVPLSWPPSNGVPLTYPPRRKQQSKHREQRAWRAAGGASTARETGLHDREAARGGVAHVLLRVRRQRRQLMAPERQIRRREQGPAPVLRDLRDVGSSVQRDVNQRARLGMARDHGPALLHLGAVRRRLDRRSRRQGVRHGEGDGQRLQRHIARRIRGCR